MNNRETVIKANRQIRLLMESYSDTERGLLNKRIRPLPVPPRRKYGEPVHISTILPVVMANIEQRIQNAEGVLL